jgi:dTDP-4-dehydrorhamnose reductase
MNTDKRARERRILVTGGGGQIATELALAPRRDGLVPRVMTRAELDITRPEAVERAIRDVGPGLIVNTAAYTAVDAAEDNAALAHAVNADGPGLLAEAAAARGIPLIHLSTDYVFDGEKEGAYVEDDPVRPLGVYGASKAAGEARVREATAAHVILRTAWVYSAHGRNFVTTMLRLAAGREEIAVVADQRGAPTAAGDVAAAVLRIAGAVLAGDGPWGTYHYAGAGTATWFEFAGEIFRLAAPALPRAPRLVPIATRDRPDTAPRPCNSVLDCTKIEADFGLRPVPWRESLARVVAELTAATSTASRA